ncbi:hypothetical protein ACFWIJ_33365 [Streptomyces sp. NPDC127079]|uniref:hypothetical protein n=1 Tax=Streptomyces sp. NPDC127079 TaxID=3347132 RepID=UPI003646762D
MVWSQVEATSGAAGRPGQEKQSQTSSAGSVARQPRPGWSSASSQAHGGLAASVSQAPAAGPRTPPAPHPAP